MWSADKEPDYVPITGDAERVVAACTVESPQAAVQAFLIADTGALCRGS